MAVLVGEVSHSLRGHATEAEDIGLVIGNVQYMRPSNARALFTVKHLVGG